MAKNRKIFMFSVVALLILSVAMAFSILDQGNREQNDTVSVIVDNSNSSRWTSLKEGLDAAAKDYGIRLNYVSTSVFWSKTQELDIVERELESGADGIILQLYASEGVHERLEQVVSRDRCVLLETDMTPEEYYQTVGPDNRKLGGVLAGELKADFGERLRGKRIGVLCGNTGQLAIRQRMEGLKEGLKNTGAVIQWTLAEMGRTQNMDAVRSCWEKQADIVIALDNTEMERAVDYMEENGLKRRDCALYGIGNSEKVVYYLDRGLIRTLVVPNEFYMGYQSMEEIAYKLGYQASGRPNVETGYLVVDQTNLYDETNQKILFPIVQ